MAGTDRKKGPQEQAGDKTTKPPPRPAEDDDEPDDGDFATPKRDRSGNDDEPL